VARDEHCNPIVRASYEDLADLIAEAAERFQKIRAQQQHDLDVMRGRLREAEEKVTVCHDCYWELARTTGYNGDTSEHADVMAWAEDHRNALATADVRYNELARAAGYPRDIVGHVDVLEWVRSRRREGVA
jgi:cellobiose-specific phosphotransferase system component IIA